VLAFLRRLWLLAWYSHEVNYVLLRDGRIGLVTKAPGIWGDTWETDRGTIHTRDIRYIGDKQDAFGC
jgi:hypothetical protein